MNKLFPAKELQLEDQALVPANETTVATIAPTPLDMLNRAMDKGLDPEQLDKFIDLHHKWEANEARKAFVLAMSKFRAEPILINKSKSVSYKNKTGGTTNYKHATLDQVVAAALPHMSANGLAHRWETKQEDDQISVTCIITHEQGHSERTVLTASPDQSGGKNSIQAIGSTVSYLERYTFMAATGLAASDMDNDGGQPSETINEQQAADLVALMDEISLTPSRKKSFFKWAKISAVEEMPAADYAFACKYLKKIGAA